MMSAGELRRRLAARVGGDRAERMPDPRLAELEQRIEHLEAAFEGLQDAVYRETNRQDRRLDDLTKTTQPEAMARALSDDARRRGL